MTTASQHTQDNDRGFSLVELLVVIFIVGLMSTVVVLSLPDDEASLSSAADDVSIILGRLQREAILQGKPVRWRYSKTQNTVETYSKQQWSALDDRSRIYSRFQLNDDIEFKVSLVEFANGKSKSSYGVREARDTKEVVTPAIVFLPTGESTATTITLSTFERNIVLSLAADGRVKRYE